MKIKHLKMLREELKKECMSDDDINLVLNSIISVEGDDE